MVLGYEQDGVPAEETMIPFTLYLTGSVILTFASIYGLVGAKVRGEPTVTHWCFTVASVVFCLGGIAGLAGL
jgi:hypothetical protein